MRSWDSHTPPLHVQQEYQTQSVSWAEAVTLRCVKFLLLNKRIQRQIKALEAERIHGVACSQSEQSLQACCIRDVMATVCIYPLLKVNDNYTVKKSKLV